MRRILGTNCACDETNLTLHLTTEIDYARTRLDVAIQIILQKGITPCKQSLWRDLISKKRTVRASSLPSRPTTENKAPKKLQ